MWYIHLRAHQKIMQRKSPLSDWLAGASMSLFQFYSSQNLCNWHIDTAKHVWVFNIHIPDICHIFKALLYHKFYFYIKIGDKIRMPVWTLTGEVHSNGGFTHKLSDAHMEALKFSKATILESLLWLTMITTIIKKLVSFL